jgi:hypothetical protein
MFEIIHDMFDNYTYKQIIKLKQLYSCINNYIHLINLTEYNIGSTGAVNDAQLPPGPVNIGIGANPYPIRFDIIPILNIPMLNPNPQYIAYPLDSELFYCKEDIIKLSRIIINTSKFSLNIASDIFNSNLYIDTNQNVKSDINHIITTILRLYRIAHRFTQPDIYFKDAELLNYPINHNYEYIKEINNLIRTNGLMITNNIPKELNYYLTKYQQILNEYNKYDISSKVINSSILALAASNYTISNVQLINKLLVDNDIKPSKDNYIYHNAIIFNTYFLHNNNNKIDNNENLGIFNKLNIYIIKEVLYKKNTNIFKYIYATANAVPANDLYESYIYYLDIYYNDLKLFVLLYVLNFVSS